MVIEKSSSQELKHGSDGAGRRMLFLFPERLVLGCEEAAGGRVCLLFWAVFGGRWLGDG